MPFVSVVDPKLKSIVEEIQQAGFATIKCFEAGENAFCALAILLLVKLANNYYLAVELYAFLYGIHQEYDLILRFEQIAFAIAD